MNVIITLNLEAECRSKCQFFSLHCIDVYFLKRMKKKTQHIYTQMSVTLSVKYVFNHFI